MTRFRFWQSFDRSGALLLALVLWFGVSSTGIGAIAAEPIFPEMPGMVSYTYRNQFSKDVQGTLDKIRALGIQDMEFSNLFGKTAAELRAMLDERDMFCSSFGVSFNDVQNELDEVAEKAKTLGAKYVRVAWVPHKAPFSLEDTLRTAEVFNRVGKELLDKHGLSFCYHNHGYEFVPHEDGTLFDVLMRETDPKYVSIELDILWAHFPGADVVAIIEKYGDRIPLMHLKDLKKGVQGDLSGKTPVENDVALGTGQIDLPRILMAARKAGVKHYYIEDESPSIDTQVPQSIEYLKNLTTDALK
jgi:sugar phosphate isomerase/epimerase